MLRTGSPHEDLLFQWTLSDLNRAHWDGFPRILTLLLEPMEVFLSLFTDQMSS
jgi:hypothetical protein